MKSTWYAGLSDGSTVRETKPIPGERTSWQKLLKRCREDDSLSIYSMWLQVGPIRISAMPHKECDGFFQAREHLRSMYGSKTPKDRHGVGSIVGDKVIITWIEQLENKSYLTRSDMRPLNTCKVHTTAQE